MAARKMYPAPECPRCGKAVSRVKNTYYTKDGRIARTRECGICQWSCWSVQYEFNVDPAKFRLSIPNHRSQQGEGDRNCPAIDGLSPL